MSTPASESTIADRIYTGIMVAIAAILLAIALFRPAAHTVTVTGSVDLRREQDGKRLPISAEQIESEIRQPVVINQLVAGLDPKIRDSIKQPTNDWWTDAVAQSLTVQAESSSAELASTQLKLTTRGVNEVLQLALIEQVQEYIQETYHAPETGPSDEAFERQRARVAAAVDRLDEIQDKLKNFTESRIEEAREEYHASLRAAVAKFMQSQPQSDSGAKYASQEKASKARPLPVVSVVNPEWREIEAELETLRELEADRNHPSIHPEARVEYADAVNRLADRIKSTSQTVNVKHGFIDNPFASRNKAEPANPKSDEGSEIDDFLKLAHGDLDEEASNPTSAMTPAPEEQEPVKKSVRVSRVLAKMPPFDEVAARRQVEELDEFRELIGKFQAARSARDDALDALESQPQQDDRIISVVSNLTKPVVADRQSEFSSGFLLQMIVPGLLLGGLCSVLKKNAPPPDAFISPEDAEDWLDFPVVGQITTRDGPLIPTPPPPTVPGYIKTVRRISEGVVCLILLVIIYSVITVSGFGKELFNDPLHGYVEAIDNITSWMS